ncbi:LemA family protein [Bordetella genomosp. 13]|uniref:LemA family protein n=1 Tax=Bordetella genomosp. 13 TaxID=463040 RepID=UPI0011A2984A|nr:LemA family protein [Bordetella genomosp. 13]
MFASTWVVAVCIAVVAVLGYVVITYNALVRLRALAREGWSGISVQLRRRTDLVPNLVETVKAYAAHEKGIFDEIAARRATSINAAGVAQQAQAEQALNQSLGRLMAIAEAYPDLKADANFRGLQDSLAEIEDQLQMARRYYNGTARELNIRVESFPSNLVAGSFGFRQEAYFELDDPADAAVPHVAF